LPQLLRKQLQRDTWTGEISQQTTGGRICESGTEVWSETYCTYDLTTIRNDRTPCGLNCDETLAILKGLRPALRDTIESMGGEQVDFRFTLAYRERILDLYYRIDKINGRITVRITPVADTPEELRTRVEVVIVERPE
jgi:hypothetical protein